jgi:hypothetical protein
MIVPRLAGASTSGVRRRVTKIANHRIVYDNHLSKGSIISRIEVAGGELRQPVNWLQGDVNRLASTMMLDADIVELLLHHERTHGLFFYTLPDTTTTAARFRP